MTALTNFAFEEQLVRVIELDGEPWFVGKDVCNALGISKHRDAIASLDADEGRPVTVDTLGGPQQMACVSEPGVYRLVFRSHKPEAERFKRWLAHEVIPAIRRHGRYQVDMPQEAAPSDQWLALKLVREARQLYGPARARALWESLPALPAVPGGLQGMTAGEASTLVAHILAAETDTGASVAETITAARIHGDRLCKALWPLGLRLVDEHDAAGLAVAINPHLTRRLFAATSWAQSYAGLILALPGAHQTKAYKFASNMVSKAVLIPMALITN